MAYSDNISSCVFCKYVSVHVLQWDASIACSSSFLSIRRVSLIDCPMSESDGLHLNSESQINKDRSKCVIESTLEAVCRLRVT